MPSLGLSTSANLMRPLLIPPIDRTVLIPSHFFFFVSVSADTRGIIQSHMHSDSPHDPGPGSRLACIRSQHAVFIHPNYCPSVALELGNADRHDPLIQTCDCTYLRVDASTPRSTPSSPRSPHFHSSTPPPPRLSTHMPTLEAPRCTIRILLCAPRTPSRVLLAAGHEDSVL